MIRSCNKTTFQTGDFFLIFSHFKPDMKESYKRNTAYLNKLLSEKKNKTGSENIKDVKGLVGNIYIKF